jgi:hypothetical protein
LADIGGGDTIREMCTRFYSFMFEDKLLKTFLFVDDGPEGHAKRLGDWIIEKLGGEGLPWSDSGRHGTRQQQHRLAWNNTKRDRSVRGRPFDITDTRVWQRLHFLAARECGLAEHAAFWGLYVKFIAHFIGVYESRAPNYTAIDSEWSADPSNVQQYFSNGRTMRDIMGSRR